MDKVLLYKNKAEVFKCQFSIDGTDPKDAVVRLCLEFDDNRNQFFYGKLHENGSCEIVVPPLRNLDKKEGRLIIEAIADSMYFKVYEATIELKNSVEVRLKATETSAAMNTMSDPDVKMEHIERHTVEEPIDPNHNPYIPKTKRK